MDKIWIKIVASTGSVGVCGLLLFTFINKVFSQEVAQSIGKDNLAYTIFSLTVFLGIALILSILKSKDKSQASTDAGVSQNKNIKVTYGDKSTHNGDNNF